MLDYRMVPEIESVMVREVLRMPALEKLYFLQSAGKVAQVLEMRLDQLSTKIPVLMSVPVMDLLSGEE